MIVLKAVILGVVEGVTEFLPVSSTGHLILTSALIEYPEAKRAPFEIFIQLGAILAVVWHFRAHLMQLVVSAPSDLGARSLLGKVGVAFLPAAVAGLFLHHAIEEHLFSPRAVASALIVGGVVILGVERRTWGTSARSIEKATWHQALWTGVAQVASLFPGVSRAAATIVGGMVTGMSRPVATQFSFYLSMPTLGAASVYSLFKARHLLAASDLLPLAAGFLVSFASALLVVRTFVTFVQRHTFTGFGYYRIILGVLVLLILR